MSKWCEWFEDYVITLINSNMPKMQCPNILQYANIKASALLSVFFLKGVVWAKMVKIVKFLFFAQKVSSGMGALRPKFLGG